MASRPQCSCAKRVRRSKQLPGWSWRGDGETNCERRASTAAAHQSPSKSSTDFETLQLRFGLVVVLERSRRAEIRFAERALGEHQDMCRAVRQRLVWADLDPHKI